MRLSKPVLLLNASYEPLKVINWKRAINLYFLNKVEILETYDSCVRSVSITIYLPSVVRLVTMAKYFCRSVPLTRQNILCRDNFTCQYCGIKLLGQNATLDHVIPRSRGGLSTWDNLVACCKDCNKKKGDRSPQEANMPLKMLPKKPLWLPVLKFKDEIPLSWRTYIYS
ncbi:MAG: HNH endonuclease [Deltaproteobacteria bacterium]|nr:HNH endonuclease [Deltaproteobacteria bacterium]